MTEAAVITNVVSVASGAEALPCTLDEVKDHCRVLSDAEGPRLLDLVRAATDYCERVTGRCLRTTSTLTQKYDCWPGCRVGFDRHPVIAITSVKYYDASNVEQTVSSSNYRLHASANAAGYLEFDSQYSRPSHYTRDDAVSITYTAGYGSVDSVPAAAKHAVLLLCGHWYEHGEAVNIGNIPTEVPMGVDALLGSIDWGCYR